MWSSDLIVELRLHESQLQRIRFARRCVQLINSPVLPCDIVMSTTGHSTKQVRSRKPSYKIMIITAIASQTKSRRGTSRQRIASYLQQHYAVSSGGRFNAALRSALNSGIQSGIFKFGETKQRFKLTKNSRKQCKAKRKKTIKTKKRGQESNKRIDAKNTTDNSTLDDVVLSQMKDVSTGHRVEKGENDGIDTQSETRELLERAKTPFVRDSALRLINQNIDTNAELVADENQIVLPMRNDGESLSEENQFNNDEQFEGEESNSVAHIALRQHVNRAENPADLLCIASQSHFIHDVLYNMKGIILKKVNEMDDDSARVARYNALPINDVLSEDVMQLILSFGHLNQNRTVCRQWNRLNKQNENKMLRRMYNAVDDRNLESLGSAGQTWIIHPKRTTLHPLEIRRGYLGPVRSPRQVPHRIRTRLLFHPGHYRVVERLTNVQYIGLSPVHQTQCSINLKINSFGWKQHFANLVVNVKHEGHFKNICNGTEYIFNQCTIAMDTSSNSLTVGDRGTLHIAQSVIRSPHSPINIWSSAREAIVTDTLFVDCLQCVWIVDWNKRGQRQGRFVKVKITNNRFHNTKDLHLVMNVDGVDEWTQRRSDQCVIAGNVATRDTCAPAGPLNWNPNTLHILDRTSASN